MKFSTERQTKTRTGENTRNVRESKPKMFENLHNNDRCPVPAYLAYKHRPPEMMADDSPFYLAVNTEVPKAWKKWFKAAPLGVNSLRSMVKNMLAASQVHSDKKLVNHSTRKHLVQKLVDNNFPPNKIVGSIVVSGTRPFFICIPDFIICAGFLYSFSKYEIKYRIQGQSQIWNQI